MKRVVVLPLVRAVPAASVDRMRAKWSESWVWQAFQSRHEQPAPERNPIPRYLRAVVDDEFSGPIG